MIWISMTKTSVKPNKLICCGDKPGKYLSLQQEVKKNIQDVFLSLPFAKLWVVSHRSKNNFTFPPLLNLFLHNTEKDVFGAILPIVEERRDEKSCVLWRLSVTVDDTMFISMVPLGKGWWDWLRWIKHAIGTMSPSHLNKIFQPFILHNRRW